MEALFLPRNLDDPTQILLWSADEVLPGLIIFLVAILIDQGFIGLILAFGVTKFFKKFKDGKQEGYLLHAIYYLGFINNKSKTMPNPYQREYYT